MTRSCTFCLPIALLVFAVLHCPSHAETIFDNTQTLGTTGFGPGCCATSVEVELGGTGRVLTSVGWVFSGQSSGVDRATIDLGVYANDGPDDAPGTLLWTTQIIDLQVGPGIDLYTFPVPDVQVPGRITVTSHMLSAQPIAVGRVHGEATSVGEMIELWYFDEPDNIHRWTNNSRRYAIQLTAVPEPSSLILAALGMLFMAAILRRRSR